MTQGPVFLSICTDCMMFLAYGEAFDGEGNDLTAYQAGKLYAKWLTEEIRLGFSDGEDELGFSWSDCDGCGSILGGDRYAATAWVES